MTIFGRISGIAKVCLRRNLPPCLLFSLAALSGVFLFLAPSHWEAKLTTGFLETTVSLTGPVLLAPLFLPEQDPAVAHVLRARSTPLSLVYAVRCVCALLFVLVLPALSIGALELLHCEVAPGIWLSIVSISLFLGGLGAFAYAMWGNIVSAYLIPVFFYLLCMFTPKEQMEKWGLGALYLFSVRSFRPTPKPFLLALGLLLLAASIPLRCHKMKRLSP